MIGGCRDRIRSGELDIGLTGRWQRPDHNFVAIGQRLTPWLGGELSLFLLQMDQWTAEAGRSLCDQL